MISRRWLRCSLWIFCSVILVLSSVHRGDARPSYKKAFDACYAEIAKKNKTTCNVCHLGGTDDKKRRNHYGEALAKELGEKNVKDEKKIVEALKAIEEGECRSGKWKLRLEHGLAPCVCGRGDHDSVGSESLTRGKCPTTLPR